VDKTILICDDEASLRELVRAILNGGYQFAEAADGLEALELVRELKPNLILADLMMPRVSGLELLAEVRKDPQFRELPIIVVTAFAGERDAALEAGADGFLAKPFDPDELTAKVEELLQTRD
jgi:CheY-like chemotaxis protein